jgi:hypothetical protein
VPRLRGADWVAAHKRLLAQTRPHM